MIDDLSVANTNIWKYVGDTTLAECVEKNGTSLMQSRVDEFVTVSCWWFPVEWIEVQGT